MVCHFEVHKGVLLVRTEGKMLIYNDAVEYFLSIRNKMIGLETKTVLCDVRKLVNELDYYELFRLVDETLHNFQFGVKFAFVLNQTGLVDFGLLEYFTRNTHIEIRTFLDYNKALEFLHSPLFKNKHITMIKMERKGLTG